MIRALLSTLLVFCLFSPPSVLAQDIPADEYLVPVHFFTHHDQEQILGVLAITPLGSYDDQRKYTGHEYDTQTDLTYANARYYDQDIGKFFSIDPASRDNPQKFLEDPQQLNAYSYARDNPLILKDETGKFVSPLDVALTIGFIGYDLYKIATEGFSTSNTASLGLDATGLIPFVPVGFLKVAKVADRAVDTAKTLDKLPDSTLVCRGGACVAKDFAQGTGVKTGADGTLSGVSVYVGVNGESKADLFKMLPKRFEGKGGFSTVGELKQSGVTGVQKGADQNHFNVTGQKPSGFEELFKNKKE